jgi:hypothetical protein
MFITNMSKMEFTFYVKNVIQNGCGVIMNRNEFREAVFKRDGYKCVICKEPAVDAHHIVERRLFPDGGYYLDNGASLCSNHHLEAEMTTLSCEEIREAAGIKTIILPPHFDSTQRFDKWGNKFWSDGSGYRHKGPIFDDEGQQKILKRGGVLWRFQ